MIIDDELLRKNGLTKITTTQDTWNNIYSDYNSPICYPVPKTFELSFELDSDGVEKLQDALKCLDKTPDIETKSELLTMHQVNEAEGHNIFEKIDNYISGKNEKKTDTFVKMYKIKHR